MSTTAMASLASSCSAFLEGEAVRVPRSESQRPRNGAPSCVQAKLSEGEKAGLIMSRRQAACAFIAGALVLPVAPMARALLEADDDDSLLEKVKEDKKKRIQKRSTAINEFVKESGIVLILSCAICPRIVVGNVEVCECAMTIERKPGRDISWQISHSVDYEMIISVLRWTF